MARSDVFEDSSDEAEAEAEDSAALERDVQLMVRLSFMFKDDNAQSVYNKWPSYLHLFQRQVS